MNRGRCINLLVGVNRVSVHVHLNAIVEILEGLGVTGDFGLLGHSRLLQRTCLAAWLFGPSQKSMGDGRVVMDVIDHVEVLLQIVALRPLKAWEAPAEDPCLHQLMLSGHVLATFQALVEGGVLRALELSYRGDAIFFGQFLELKQAGEVLLVQGDGILPLCDAYHSSPKRKILSLCVPWMASCVSTPSRMIDPLD